MTIISAQNQAQLRSDIKQTVMQKREQEQGSCSIFERVDDAIGLNALKKGIKKYSGLDYITDKITDAIDDGNDGNLSLGERIWEGVKGAGKAVENFVGSQGLAFMGVLALGSFAANKAGIGKAFNILTKGYFLYEGAKLTYTGTRDFIKAETKEEAKDASTTATTGGIMLYGTIKGIRKDIKNYKAVKAEFSTKVRNARAKLEIPEGEKLTKSNLVKAYRKAVHKYHPDKGGSADTMAEVSNAYEFLTENLKSASRIKPSAQPQVTETVSNIENVSDNTPVKNETGSQNTAKGLKKYVKPEVSQKTFAPQEDLCWNIKTHMAITEQAIKDYDGLSPALKRYVARASELPDLDPKETVDFISPHFYDVLNEDPSFGTVNDAENNALSRFLSHTEKAKQFAKEGHVDSFLKEIGYAVHYLQDAATPPHTEHGNYIHKLYRVPMHKAFESGKNVGATQRLPILNENYTPEEIPLSSLEMLFHNTALYSVQPENHVSYSNVRKWPEIQQRCYDRSVNATKTYLDYILQYYPDKSIK